MASSEEQEQFLQWVTLMTFASEKKHRKYGRVRILGDRCVKRERANMSTTGEGFWIRDKFKKSRSEEFWRMFSIIA